MVFITALLLVLAPVTFALGIMLPLVRFEKLYFFDETPSLVGMVSSLFDGGDYLLAFIVALFSIIFPFIKQLAVMLEVVQGQRTGTNFAEKLVPILSKWSMMDVLLVALVIVAAKTTGIASAISQPGLWFYAASTLIIIIAQYFIRKLDFARKLDIKNTNDPV